MTIPVVKPRDSRGKTAGSVVVAGHLGSHAPLIHGTALVERWLMRSENENWVFFYKTSFGRVKVRQ